MSQFNAPAPRRASGQIDVYTALLGIAALVLAVGCYLMASKNMTHSGEGSQSGSMFKLVEK
ncbi:MAG: hypothetical protein AAF432_11470 [Planctomycetota bacterium]